MIKLMCQLLYNKYGVFYSRDILLGLSERRLTPAEMNFLSVDCKPYLDFVDSKLTIIDTAASPDKMLDYLRQSIVKQDDPNFYNLIIVDTTNAMSANPSMTKIESLKRWNQDYALKVFRNEKQCALIHLQQQDKASSTRQFNNKGESVEDKYVPTLEALAGDKEAANSANLVMSLFNPLTFNISTWMGYRVTSFQGGFRCIYINKNNFGDNNAVIPYFFNVKTGVWHEIEEDPSDFKANPELYNKYLTSEVKKELKVSQFLE